MQASTMSEVKEYDIRMITSDQMLWRDDTSAPESEFHEDKT
jgi:hypothetical protein